MTIVIHPTVPRWPPHKDPAPPAPPWTHSRLRGLSFSYHCQKPGFRGGRGGRNVEGKTTSVTKSNDPASAGESKIAGRRFRRYITIEINFDLVGVIAPSAKAGISWWKRGRSGDLARTNTRLGSWSFEFEQDSKESTRNLPAAITDEDGPA